jgi:hypothetical protein
MTDASDIETENATDDPSAQSDADATDEAESDTEDESGSKIVGYAQWAGFFVLVLLVLISTLRFYFAASTAINRFISPDFRPVFQAVFNLVVLLASVVGLSVLVKRMR